MPAEPPVDTRDFAQIPGSRLEPGCLQQLPCERTVRKIRPRRRRILSCKVIRRKIK